MHVSLTLSEPFGLVIEMLGKPSSNVPFMMPEQVAKTDPASRSTEATGSGPFIFKRDEWVPGSKAVYIKNPNYVPRKEPADGLRAARSSRLIASNGSGSRIRTRATR